LVFPCHDFVRECVEGVAGEGGVGGGAEDDADGRIFAFLRPVLAGVAEVEVHLAGIGVVEGAEIEVNDDEAAQVAVEEDEVHAIPLAAHTEAALASDEGEVAAEFEQEGFEVADEGVFEVGLGVFVAEVEELEHERVAHGFVHAVGVAGLRLRAFAEHGGFVFGKQGALVEEGADLPVELAHTPAAAQGFVFIEVAGVFVLHGEELHVVRPRKRKAGGEGAEEFNPIG